MTVSINIIAIAPVAAADEVNAVLEAMGRGPDSLIKKLTSATETPAYTDAATHLYMSDQGVTAEFQSQLLAAVSGDLPPLAEGKVWGEDGVIGASAAMAAMAQLFVVSFANGTEPEQQRAAAIAAHSPALYVIPDPPL